MRLSLLIAPIATALVAAAPAACNEGTAPRPNRRGLTGSPERLLFIGNSLTADNDLPGMVAGLAGAAGYVITVHASLYGGTSLEDHWNRQEAKTLVERGDYDVVILQQGPSALESSRVNLREWTARWAPVIRNAGGEPALYAVWPSEERSFDFPRVSESYRLAAQDVNGIFLPAGDTWLHTWARDPQAPLYAGDRFHPSLEGTYAAAVVIVARLFNKSPTSLPSTFDAPGLGTIQIDPALALAIQHGADDALNGVQGQLPAIGDPAR